MLYRPVCQVKPTRKQRLPVIFVIAFMLGKPRAAREVGRAMRICPNHLPWQRVVKADGTVAGGSHAEIRKGLLESEGVAFTPDGRVNMALSNVREGFHLSASNFNAFETSL